MKKRKINTIAIIALLFFHNESFAVLPGSIEPGRVSQSLTSQPSTLPRAQAAAPSTEEKVENKLGPEATKITFPLKKIILEGNTVFSEPELFKLYKNKLNKVISVVELQDIVQDITNFYRNNGYILSRAVLPPQHIAHGVVHIRIIEGYIDQVHVLGSPKNAGPLLTAYGKHVQESKPLQLKVMERYLLLANEIPGMHVRSVLEPSKIKTEGVSDLNLIGEEQYFTGYVTYDNYQSRYTGPLEITANLNVNSAIRAGDSTHFTYVNTSEPSELRFFDISHETPLGTNGMRILLGGNKSITKPEFVLAPVELEGDANTYYATLTYSLLRSRSENITFDGGLTYLDSSLSAFDVPLYTDHLRTLKVGVNYDFYDRFSGGNLIVAHIEKGFPWFGATTGPSSLNTSRFGADGNFIKFMGQVSRQQAIRGPFSVFGTVSGQYSPVPLLVSEQFGYGGATLGRGYDPSELLGDKGVSGSIELRVNTFPGWKLLQTAQFFTFYDAGVVWNLNNANGINSKDSATSVGVGFRFNFTKNISGNWTIAQPLTRQISSLSFIGRGRAPRTLFSVTVSA